MLHVLKLKYIPATNTKPRRMAITAQAYCRVVYNLDGLQHEVEEVVERYTTEIMKKKYHNVYRHGTFEDTTGTYLILETK